MSQILYLHVHITIYVRYGPLFDYHDLVTYKAARGPLGASSRLFPDAAMLYL
jgi:hypothetical protein